MNVPFVSPSTFVNQHSRLHIVSLFFIGLLLDSVLIAGVYVWVVTSHVFDAKGWSRIGNKGVMTSKPA